MKHSQKTGLLFGTFDGLHPGHVFFINKAQILVDKLYISVAHDDVVKTFKGRLPHEKQSVRMEKLTNAFPNCSIICGDKTIGEWSALKKLSPDIVCVGYDQDSLKEALVKIKSLYRFEIHQIKSFRPDTYKSSLLRNNKNT